jgi:hypothetical protein
MKSQDFDRLKAICEKEGFELVTESPKENDKFYVVKKRVKERVSVINFGISNIGMKNTYSFLVDFASKVTKTEEEISGFLTKQLEKYLNDEI